MELEFEELLTPDSLQELRKVALKVWPRTFAEILSQKQIEYMMQMMYAPQVLTEELSNGVHFELLRIDREPAGYISYSAYLQEPGTAKLHKVYLLPEFHSQGIGQQMLDHAQKQCCKLGFKTVMLCVNKHNERAIKAYKRNGFVIEKALCTPIGEGFYMDDYIMKKGLV